jgi:hypothetical protein
MQGLHSVKTNLYNDWRRDMSAYERQILNTERYYDRQILEVENSGVEILSSVVPGSRLHEYIHNPVDEGIDEG